MMYAMDTITTCSGDAHVFADGAVACPISGGPCKSGVCTGGGGGAKAAIYEQCGGKAFAGPTACRAGLVCKKKNTYYSQCLPGLKGSSIGVGPYKQCGGKGYSGATKCKPGLTCTKSNEYYSQCKP